MRIIGMDIHRVLTEAVVLKDGALRRLWRVDMARDKLLEFASSLPPTDHVVVESTGNAAALLRSSRRRWCGLR